MSDRALAGVRLWVLVVALFVSLAADLAFAGRASAAEAGDYTIAAAITMADVSPPTVMLDLSLTSSGTANPANELFVSWDRQTLPDGDAITGFDVQYQVLGTDEWTDHPFDGTGLSATITGLASNTGYGVQVRAVNAVGPGPWSMTASSLSEKYQPTTNFVIFALEIPTLVQVMPIHIY